MSDMKAYLASKYMSGPKADAILARSSDPTLKKRKKKPKNEDYTVKLEAGEGLRMRDEDEWKGAQDGDMDVDGEDAPVIGKSLATFQKSKNTWATVGSTSLPLASQALTAGPSRVGGAEDPQEEDIKPDISEPQEKEKEKKPTTIRQGGLKTAAQIREEAAVVAAAKAAALAEAEEEARASGQVTTAGQGAQGQTVHRDSSGRIVDVEKLKKEAKEKEEEEKRKAREREEWSKGMVQRQGQRERARQEEEMGRTDVARHADDVQINREMREVERWNDPAAEFMTKKKKKGPRRPKYQGPSGPNRFNILPGFRWDGVDRSNGFEKKYFQHQNTVARRGYAADQMGMEDM